MNHELINKIIKLYKIKKLNLFRCMALLRLCARMSYLSWRDAKKKIR